MLKYTSNSINEKRELKGLNEKMGSKQSKAEDLSETSHLSDPTIDLLMVNTDLTRDQIIKIHQEFLKDCPNGLLYKKDFIKMFKQLHSSEKKRSKADKYCEYVFK